MNNIFTYYILLFNATFEFAEGGIVKHLSWKNYEIREALGGMFLP